MEPIQSNKHNFTNMLKFLELVGHLKHVKRTGWVMQDVPDCETITGHMYRMSMMTFLLEDGVTGDKQRLDRIKCMELALVHDLAESIVGDITPFCGISREEKKHREQTAMAEIVKLLGERGEHLLRLFNEYEEQETPESKFVKDIDRFDMILQAFEYEKRDKCPNKHQVFFDSVNGKINHPLINGLVDELNMQRQQMNVEHVKLTDVKPVIDITDRDSTDCCSASIVDAVSKCSSSTINVTADVASTATTPPTTTTTTTTNSPPSPTTTADHIQ